MLYFAFAICNNMLRNLQFNPLKQELKENLRRLQESTTALRQSTSLQQTPADFTSLSEKQRQGNVQEHKTLPELEQSLVLHRNLFELLDIVFSPQYLEKPIIETTVDEKLELGLRFFRQLDPDLLTLIDKFVQLESDPLPEALAPIDIIFQDDGVHVSEVDISETVPKNVPVERFDLIEADPNKNDEVDHGWGEFFSGSDADSGDSDDINSDASLVDGATTDNPETNLSDDSGEDIAKSGEANLSDDSVDKIIDGDNEIDTTTLSNHKPWVEKGLEPIFWRLKPRRVLENQFPADGETFYLKKLQIYLKHHGKSLDEDVLYGRKIDPGHFTEIITFNQKLLARLYPGHHIYSSLDSYKAHVATVAPDLLQIETPKYESFIDFQKAILDKYLYPPKEENKKEFFAKTLPENLKIYLPSLIQAADEHSEQLITLQNRTRTHFQPLLERAEKNCTHQERGLMNNDLKYEEEIKKLVERYVDSLVQELLLNQLIKTIWKDEGIRKSVSASDYHLRTDFLNSSQTKIKNKSEFKSINLLAADPEWLKFISFYTNQMIDIEVLSGLQIGTKVRLLTAIENFAKTQASKKLSVAQINLLCGIEKPLNEEDLNLLKEFIDFIGADYNKALVQFPDKLVINQQEASSMVKANLAALDATNFNQAWITATNNTTQNPELVARFLRKVNENKDFLDPERRKRDIAIINGDSRYFTEENKTTSQNLLRSYISFLNYGIERESLNIADWNFISLFPDLLGIRGQYELSDLIKAKGYICGDDPKNSSDNPKDAYGRKMNPDGKKVFNNQTVQGVQDYVAKISLDTNIPLEEMYRIAEVSEPKSFYADPINQCAKYFEGKLKTSDQQIKILDAIERKRNEIRARNFVQTIISEGFYNIPTNITINIPKPEAPEPDQERLNFDLSEYSINCNFQEKLKKARGTVTHETTDTQCYRYDSDNQIWVKDNDFSDRDIDKAYSKIFSQECNNSWMSKVFSICNGIDGKVHTHRLFEDFIKEKTSALRTEDVKKVLEVTMGTASRFATTLTQEERSANQALFREFVNYTYEKTKDPTLKLDSIIAEFPKLTGVRDLGELKLIADRYREENRVEFNFAPDPANINRPEEIVSRKILPKAGITVTDLDSFPDYQVIKQRYQDGLTILLGEDNDKRIIPIILNPTSSKMMPFILANELFPELKNNKNLSREMDFKGASPPLGLTVCNNFMRIVNAEQCSDIKFNQQEQKWELKRFSKAFNIFRSVRADLRKTTTDSLEEASEALLSIPAEDPDSVGSIHLFLRLVDDFLVKTFPNTPVNDPEIITASSAVLCSNKIFDPSINQTIRTKAFQYLKDFVEFANERYPGFADIEKVRKVLGTENQVASTSILDDIREKYSHEDFRETIKDASDSGYAELSRIATENGLTFDELYEQAGLENPTIKYSKHLSRSLTNVFARSVDFDTESLDSMEKLTQDFFANNAQWLKTWELRHAIWDDSMSYIKLLAKMEDTWLAVTINGSDSINLLRTNSTGVIDGQTMGPEYQKYYTHTGKLTYGGETKTWVQPVQRIPSNSLNSPPINPDKSLSALTQVQLAIDEIGKQKEWWLEQVKQNPAQLVQTFKNYLNKLELDPSPTLESLLEFYGLDRYTHIYPTISGISYALWRQDAKMEDQNIDRVSVVAVLGKIFKDQKSFIVPAGQKNNDEGNTFATNGIDYAQERLSNADGSDSVLREIELTEGKWVVAPTSVNAESNREKAPGKESLLMDIARALEEQFPKITTTEHLDGDLRLLSDLANKFELSLKELFDLMDIGFLVNTDGTINRAWIADLIQFIETTLRKSNLGIDGEFEVPTATILEALLKKFFSRLTDSKLKDRDFTVNSPLVNDKISLSLGFTTTNTIKLILNPDTSGKQILGTRPINPPPAQFTPLEIAEALEKQKITDQLLKANSQTAVEGIISSIGNRFNLPIKTIFDQLGIGFIITQDGNINISWLDDLASFVETNIQKTDIENEIVIPAGPMIGILLKRVIFKIKLPTADCRVGFPIADPKDIDLQIYYALNDQIQIILNSDTPKEKILGERPANLAPATPLEIAKKLGEQNLATKLSEAERVEEYQQLLSDAASQFNLSIKEMYDQLGIGSLIDDEGNVNPEWKRFVNDFINRTVNRVAESITLPTLREEISMSFVNASALDLAIKLRTMKDMDGSCMTMRLSEDNDSVQLVILRDKISIVYTKPGVASPIVLGEQALPSPISPAKNLTEAPASSSSIELPSEADVKEYARGLFQNWRLAKKTLSDHEKIADFLSDLAKYFKVNHNDLFKIAGLEQDSNHFFDDAIKMFCKEPAYHGSALLKVDDIIKIANERIKDQIKRDLDLGRLLYWLWSDYTKSDTSITFDLGKLYKTQIIFQCDNQINFIIKDFKTSTPLGAYCYAYDNGHWVRNDAKAMISELRKILSSEEQLNSLRISIQHRGTLKTLDKSIKQINPQMGINVSLESVLDILEPDRDKELEDRALFALTKLVGGIDLKS